MTDICALLNEMERDVLPLTFFFVFFFLWGGGGWGWSQYHGEKIGYAIKLNIVMLEWSSTQLWSPDAI